MSVLLKRFISAFILFGVFLFTFFSNNNLFFLILISFVFFISLFEMNKLLILSKKQEFFFWLLPICAFIIHILNLNNFYFISFVSSFFWIFIASFSLFQNKVIFNNLEFSYGLIIIYSLFSSIDYLFHNNSLLLLVTLIFIWVSDIFAYFSGSFIGKKKLAPLISPGKTIEGVYGAFIANFVLISILSFFLNFSFLKLFFLIILIIPLSIIGDLFESLLKRRLGKKDSGNLIPGHGGILDRVDALCPVLPVIATMNIQGFFL